MKAANCEQLMRLPCCECDTVPTDGMVEIDSISQTGLYTYVCFDCVLRMAGEVAAFRMSQAREAVIHA
jgi:hypothetical protein